MSARVLFIEPAYETHVVPPPMGIGYLASYLQREGHDVALLNLNLSNLPREAVIARIRDYRPDIVGISIMCTGIQHARSVTETVKAAIDAPVVIGGAQASSLPEHTLRFTGADYVAVGEGEITMAELVSALGGGGGLDSILGLGYVSKGEFHLNPRRPLVKDLDSLPLPAWELMPPRRYRIAPILSSARRSPIAPVVTSRGCPFECTFCAGKSIWGRTHRFRDAGPIVDEIEMLIKDYGVREVFIGDDNFNLKPSHAADVCEEILKRGLKFPWACPNGLRVDSLTPELLELMKRAGCHLIGLGIESSSQGVLDRAKKSLDLSIVPGVCNEIRKAGIKAVGFFVFGLPGDTEETILRTIEFAKSLPLKRAWFNILAPYPGSEMFDVYAADKDLETLDWSILDTVGTCVPQMSSVPSLELDRLQKKAAWSFYARPSIILDLLLSQRPSTIAAFLRSRFFKNVLRGRR